MREGDGSTPRKGTVMPIVDRSHRPDSYWSQEQDARVAGACTSAEPRSPSWLGGEYLPECLPGEVEIARIVVHAGTRDVVSVRARRTAADRIRYRVVDEFGSAIRFAPRSSRHPLTLARLAALIESIDAGELAPPHFAWLDRLLGRPGGEPSGAIDGSATVESSFYPQLATYCKRARHRLMAGPGAR